MNTTELIARLRARYAEPEAPKCSICGAEMTIQRIGAGSVVYGCTGATYDDSGCHYAPGRNIADDHYSDSRVTVANRADPDVLALVEALESAQQENTDGVAGMAESYETTISMLRSRIVEMEARTVVVSPPAYVDGNTLGYGEVNHMIDLCVDSFERACHAAGIKCEVKGE